MSLRLPSQNGRCPDNKLELDSQRIFFLATYCTAELPSVPHERGHSPHRRPSTHRRYHRRPPACPELLSAASDLAPFCLSLCCAGTRQSVSVNTKYHIFRKVKIISWMAVVCPYLNTAHVLDNCTFPARSKYQLDYRGVLLSIPYTLNRISTF